MPVLLPLGAMFALYVAYGVSPATACLYLGYELAYIVLPGWLVYRALASAPGSKLRQLVLGWALGYVVEIVFFLLAGVTAIHGLLVAYPLLVAAVTVPVALRRRGAAAQAVGPPEPASTPAADWATAAVCALAIAYAGVALFGLLPYPGQAAIYFPDYVYHLSLAAEAKHHWPITEPAAAGEPKPYHVFAHMHLASASTTTGIDLPVVVFRLYLLPLVGLVAGSVALLARSLSRRAWVGVIAVALAVLLGEVDFDKQAVVVGQIPFVGLSFDDLILSPSFLLSQALLIPLVLVVYELLRPGGGTPARTGNWVVAALLAFGCSDAKVSALPVVVIALAVVAVWELVRTRRLPRNALAAIGLIVAVMGGLYLVQYRGADGTSELALHPFAFIGGKDMPLVELLRNYLDGLLGGLPLKAPLLVVGGGLFGAVGLLAAILVGLHWLLRLQGVRLSLAQGWLLGLFLAGLGLTEMVLGRGSLNGTYFLYHAWPMGAVLAAEGLYLACRRYGSDLRRGPARLAALALVWAVGFGLLMAAPTSFDVFARDAQAEAHTYVFWYGGLVAGLVALYAAARLLIGSGTKAPALLATGGVLLATAVGAPLDYGLPQLKGRPTNLAALAKRVTPPLYEGLTWTRDHTGTDAVLAVNNHWIDLGNVFPGWAGYSAFAERRVFIEGWYYTAKALEGGKSYIDVQTGEANPYAERLALSDAAFRGDCSALHELVARGVDYLVVDRINGTVIPPRGALDGVTRTVYENPDISVLQLLPARLASAALCKAELGSGDAPYNPRG